MSHEYDCGCQECNVIIVQSVNPAPIVVRPGQGGARGLQGAQGVQGKSGSQGIQGTRGIQGAAANIGLVSYVYNQYSPSATWNITHNLNFYPNVTTMDSSGSICEGEIDYIDSNTIRVTFLAPFSGTAYLS
jgi:hypothetical protein